MKKIIILLLLFFVIISSSCDNLGKIILSKKWKLEPYDDWYLIVDNKNPVGWIRYNLKRYNNENGEQRYTEETERHIYIFKEDKTVEDKTTRSWIETDDDLNIIKFQFYSSPMYEGDTERFTQGVIEKNVLKVLTNEKDLLEIKVSDKLPSILNYRYKISEMELKKGNKIDYEYFNIKYLTLIRENIVYAGEQEVKYQGEWVLSNKFLIMPFEKTEELDSYYFDMEERLILATIFQGKMHIQLTTRSDIASRFKIQ